MCRITVITDCGHAGIDHNQQVVHSALDFGMLGTDGKSTVASQLHWTELNDSHEDCRDESDFLSY